MVKNKGDAMHRLWQINLCFRMMAVLGAHHPQPHFIKRGRGQENVGVPSHEQVTGGGTRHESFSRHSLTGTDCYLVAV